jgi:hypothetical protein
MVMKSAKDRFGSDGADSLNWARFGLNGEVRTASKNGSSAIIAEL